jgi:hypothetical protein
MQAGESMDNIRPFVSYSSRFDGWSDELTELSEKRDQHSIDIASRQHAIGVLGRFEFPEGGALWRSDVREAICSRLPGAFISR